jgi:formylglycine-generating enzyme required for sulfatase activity
MVYVPAGAFLMGSDPTKDSSAHDDEQPQHEVHLGAFWIDKTEVTNEEYEACVQANVCTPSAYADDPAYNHSGYPVLGVDWTNARAYCQWVGGDLPTEAQWEKAARGTDGRIYPWGDELDETKANFCDVNCYLPHQARSYDDGYERTAPAHDFPDGASPYGALNMAGNTWEWVLDCYDSDFYGTTAATSNDPENEMLRCNVAVLRGGSWASSYHAIRSASRRGVNPSGEGYFGGFRCVFPAASP